MAIEVAFGVRGKTSKQAFFIQEEDWEITLNDARKLIEEQELSIPTEYRFLTVNGNAVAHPSELNLMLKDVALNFNINGPETRDRLLDLGLKSEKDEDKDKTLSLPEIWITSSKLSLSAASSDTRTLSEEPQSQSQEDETDASSSRNGSTHAQGPGQCSGCPFKILKEAFRDHGNPKSLVKLMVILMFVLFALLASLTLTMHVMVRSLTGVSDSPVVHDFFMKAGFGGATEKLTNLQVQLSQLEVSSKYEIEGLTTRMAELEDLYLKDLAIHKRELNVLKRQMAGKDSGEHHGMAEDLDEKERMSHDHDFDNKNRGKQKYMKGKETRGKGSDRIKG